MDNAELRLPEESTEPVTDQLVDGHAESQSRDLVIRGLATSVLLRSGETHAHNVPVRAFMEAAETATSWYPDKPVRPDEIRDTIL